jgi:hypothetical protein
MAKKSNTNARKRRQAEQAAQAGPKKMTRRGMFQLLGLGAVGILGLAGAGFAGRRMTRRYVSEHDLSKIGKGVPAVVQVHDPQCSMCTQLQRETRKALKQFENGELVYAIADITQIAGQVFARRHSVSHVTLVLFDGQGQVVNVLSGVRQKEELAQVFAAHVVAHGT